MDSNYAFASQFYLISGPMTSSTCRVFLFVWPMCLFDLRFKIDAMVSIYRSDQ